LLLLGPLLRCSKARVDMFGGPTPGKSARGQQAADMMIEMETMAVGCGEYVVVVVVVLNAAVGRKWKWK
jgi:hypothetical protein